MPKKSEVVMEVVEEKPMKEEKPKATGKKGGMTPMSPQIKEEVRKLIEKHKLDKSKAGKLRMLCMRGEKPSIAIKKVM